MTELSSEKQNLLLSVVDAQERALTGCATIFSALEDHPDSDVANVAIVAMRALTLNQAKIEAMIDGLTATRH